MKAYLKSIGGVLLLILGYYALQVLVSAVFAAVGGIGAAGDVEAAMTEYINANANLITLICNLAVILLISLLYRPREKRRLRALDLAPLPAGGYWPVMVCAAAAACFTSLALAILPIPESMASSYSQQLSIGAEEPLLIRLASMVFFAPIAEELLFRLAIFNRLRGAFPKGPAAALSCLVFGIMHGALLWAAYAFLVGLILTWIYDLYGSLSAPVLFHIVFNFTGMFLMPLVNFSHAVLALALLAITGLLTYFCMAHMRAISDRR